VINFKLFDVSNSIISNYSENDPSIKIKNTDSFYYFIPIITTVYNYNENQNKRNKNRITDFKEIEKLINVYYIIYILYF
jgi:hypothetical protein